MGNCRIAVSMNLATVAVCMPAGFELYLPKACTDDPLRKMQAFRTDIPYLCLKNGV